MVYKIGRELINNLINRGSREGSKLHPSHNGVALSKSRQLKCVSPTNQGGRRSEFEFRDEDQRPPKLQHYTVAVLACEPSMRPQA